MAEQSKLDSFVRELSLLFDKQPGELGGNTRLREDLNAKSAHYFGMIGTIEDLTNKSPTYAEVKSCTTIDDVIKLFHSLSE